MESIQDAVQSAESNIVSSLVEIQDAIRSQGDWGGLRLFSSLFGAGLVFFVFGLFNKGWESKARYAAYYGVSAERVIVNNEPHGCDFMRAPLGVKPCHYEKTVDVTRVGSDTKTGRPIVSHDNGKTWAWDDLTDTRTVPSVLVSYVKVED